MVGIGFRNSGLGFGFSVWGSWWMGVEGVGASRISGELKALELIYG